MSDDPPADWTRPEPAGWLGRFLGRFGLPRDPTRAWPQYDTPLPPFDLAARSLGGLRRGDPLDAAEFLGRPDAVEQTRSCLVLLYRRRGFELAFAAGRFSGLTCEVGPPSGPSPEPGRGFSRPRVSGLLLTPETTVDQVRRSFGPPVTEQTLPGEVILHYEPGPGAMEFEFEVATGRLMVWSVYLDD
jgi:hypothetical protein